MERTEAVVRTVVRRGSVQIWRVPGPSKRLSGQPCTLPEDALEGVDDYSCLLPGVDGQAVPLGKYCRSRPLTLLCGGRSSKAAILSMLDPLG
ncbi:hypothetical protein E0500_029870 [Streptomyces sp. KM273126]|uniref:hypothetical protein n=1 Tax=Streptomyces sp. KM273126 TaxID=2545247 RepID=UPI00103BA772|nr:hypothetical protein [Streptomyces sp. KM273126]MBA2811443.1 hypothetical protein [Streptomyces sp. KM273126]